MHLFVHKKWQGKSTETFFKLASDLQEERLHAAVALIKDLSALDLPDDAEEWSYVLNRLIKGLSSDRNSARLGFSLCLTEVINLAVNMPPGQRPKGLESTNEFLSTLSTILNVNVNEGTKNPWRAKMSVEFYLGSYLAWNLY